MAADGLTKGAVARDALHEFMEGHMYLRHMYEQWRCKLKNKPLQPSDSSSNNFVRTFSPLFSPVFTIGPICSHSILALPLPQEPFLTLQPWLPGITPGREAKPIEPGCTTT